MNLLSFPAAAAQVVRYIFLKEPTGPAATAGPPSVTARVDGSDLTSWSPTSLLVGQKNQKEKNMKSEKWKMENGKWNLH